MNAFDATRVKKGSRQRGFSLVEAAISTLIVGGMLVVALDTFGGAVRGRQLRADSGRAYALAMDLMSEAIANAYAEPVAGVTLTTSGGGGSVLTLGGPVVLGSGGLGPESDETADGTRRLFDDVDDYHGWSATPPQSKGGTVLTDYDGWRRAVTVIAAASSSTQTGNLIVFDPAPSDSAVKQVLVTVTDPSGRKTTLSALRSSAGAFDYAPPITTSYVSYLSVALRPSGATQAVVTGAADLNQIPYTGP